MAGQLVGLGLGTITLIGTDTTAKRLDKNVKTFSAGSSAIFANNGICVIQSYCPQNKPAVLPLFYWRPVHVHCTVCHKSIADPPELRV